MYRDQVSGWWVQDHAGESVPASHANGMEAQRRLREFGRIDIWRPATTESDFARVMCGTQPMTNYCWAAPGTTPVCLPPQVPSWIK